MANPTHSFIIPDDLIARTRKALGLPEEVAKSVVIRLAMATVISLPAGATWPGKAEPNAGRLSQSKMLPPNL